MRTILSFNNFSCSALKFAIVHCLRRNSKHSSLLSPNACILQVKVPSWPNVMFSWNRWSSSISIAIFFRSTAAALCRRSDCAPSVSSVDAFSISTQDELLPLCAFLIIVLVLGIGLFARAHWRASKKAAFQNLSECQIGWSRRYKYKYSRYGSMPGTQTEKEHLIKLPNFINKN